MIYNMNMVRKNLTEKIENRPYCFTLRYFVYCGKLEEKDQLPTRSVIWRE